MQIFYKNSSPSHCISVKLCAHILFFYIVRHVCCKAKSHYSLPYYITSWSYNLTWATNLVMSFTSLLQYCQLIHPYTTMIRHYCRFKLLITIDGDDYWDGAMLFTHSDFAILFFKVVTSHYYHYFYFYIWRQCGCRYTWCVQYQFGMKVVRLLCSSQSYIRAIINS